MIKDLVTRLGVQQWWTVSQAPTSDTPSLTKTVVFLNLLETSYHSVLWERGDRGVEEVSTEIRNQGARNGALSRPDCAPGRPPGRSVEEAGQPPGRTAWTNVHRKEAVDRPVDRLKAGLLSVV